MRAFKWLMIISAILAFSINENARSEPVEIYLVPHFHWDFAYKADEKSNLIVGINLIDQYVDLAERDEGFKFIIDQVPMVEQYLKKRKKKAGFLRELIEEGRLEITGAMYLQPDVNIPNGESLIRHILYGQRWIEKNFGCRAKYLWNIDSFGTNYQIPQIAAGAGLEAHVWAYRRTSMNRPEHFAINWKSPDGSGIRSQVLYPHYDACKELGRTKPYDRRKEWEKVESMYKTLREFDERGKYLALCGSDFTPPPGNLSELVRDWNENHDDVKLRMSIPEEYFEAAAGDMKTAQVFENDDYQVNWNGFLSNQIEDKIRNRAYENRIRQGEAVRAVANLYGMEYPQRKFEMLWIKLLMNHFHDFAAGTTADEARVDGEARFEFVKKGSEVLLNEGLDYLVKMIDTAGGAPAGAGSAMVVFNTLSFDREAVITLDDLPAGDFRLLDSDSKEITYQFMGGGVTAVLDLPAMGWKTIYVVPGAPEGFDPVEKITELKKGEKIEFSPAHGGFEISYDGNGNIVSLRTAAGKELVAGGRPLGMICVQPDEGNTYVYKPESHEFMMPVPDRVCSDEYDFGHRLTVYRGPVADRLVVAGVFRNSGIVRDERIYHNLPRVDVVNGIDWHDANFDVHATYPFGEGGWRTDSIPLGFIRRDVNGRYPLQNWTDYGDGAAGLTFATRGLMDLCHRDNIFYLALLRSISNFKTEIPSESAKTFGRHTLEYSIRPRDGKLFDAHDPYRAGQDFNDIPPVLGADLHPGRLAPEFSYMQTTDAVAVTAMFMDGGKLVLRALETKGRGGGAKIDIRLPGIKSAESTDLMIENPEKAGVVDSKLGFELRPQQVRTFVLE
ncbi:MAG TPA: glycoside hydrolase family 38 C-terminal domain-containing protein [bacterium]|nr:glycoside hydrolase family 38 C-terminal domain-containing protein [bacterium]